jgi:hypothetical protein
MEDGGDLIFWKLPIEPCKKNHSLQWLSIFESNIQNSDIRTVLLYMN